MIKRQFARIDLNADLGIRSECESLSNIFGKITNFFRREIRWCPASPRHLNHVSFLRNECCRVINFFFECNEILGYFLTIACNDRVAAAEVAQRIAKWNVYIQGHGSRAVAVVFDEIIFKSLCRVLGREHRRCGVTSVSRTRPVELFQNRKKMIINKGHIKSVITWPQIRRQRSGVRCFFLPCFVSFADTVSTQFGCWMFLQMRCRNILSA